MHIRMSIFGGCMHRNDDVVDPPASSTSFDLREEYASAFRTESYNEFWARVVDLTFPHASTQHKGGSRSAAARLPSYRLFAEHLLDPDQATITKILAHARTTAHDAATHVLLTDYYSETARVSLLCGRLLRDIERIRLLYRPLKNNLRSLVDADDSRTSLGVIDSHLAALSTTLDPSDSLASFRAVQAGSGSLVKRLQSGRKRVRAKLKGVNRLKCALTVFLVVLAAASTSVLGVHMVLVHGLAAMFCALPAPLLPASCRALSSRWLARVQAQLDAAAKGTYILNRDLDTISRLVARLRAEAEHMVALLGFCRDDCRRLTAEVVRQIWRNHESFSQQLNELEEHLYLCFMTINKARSLVMKEILESTRANTTSGS